jgi:plasmid maintenance system antidote protein VapI
VATRNLKVPRSEVAAYIREHPEMTICQIADRFDTSYGVIQGVQREYGITRRRGPRRRSSEKSAPPDAKLHSTHLELIEAMVEEAECRGVPFAALLESVLRPWLAKHAVKPGLAEHWMKGLSNDSR